MRVSNHPPRQFREEPTTLIHELLKPCGSRAGAPRIHPQPSRGWEHDASWLYGLTCKCTHGFLLLFGGWSGGGRVEALAMHPKRKGPKSDPFYAPNTRSSVRNVRVASHAGKRLLLLTDQEADCGKHGGNLKELRRIYPLGASFCTRA